jgi:tripartite-type tricarboxylate transporter receptor subunit TctC
MQQISRRRLLSTGALGLAGASLGLPAFSETPYPSKLITIKVAFPAGGPADVSVRAATVVLQRSLGQTLIADNMPGANGSIAANFVRKAAPDGYTLLGTTGIDFLVAPFTISTAKYEPASFRLLGVTGISDFVLVSSTAHSFKNVDELIDYAKKPDSKQLSIAHWGPGSAPHLVAADFQARAGIKFLEVPYKGAAPTVSDLSGGQIDLTFVPLGGSTLGMITSGRIKAIGLTSNKRNAALPDLQTIGESRSLKNFDYSLWAAVLAPPKTPDDVVARLTTAMNEWVVSPENLARITANASRRLDPMTTAQAAEFLKTEYDKFNRIARALKLDPQ